VDKIVGFLNFNCSQITHSNLRKSSSQSISNTLATVCSAKFSGVIQILFNFKIQINSSAFSKLIFSNISSSKSKKSKLKYCESSLCNCLQIVDFPLPGIHVKIIEFFIIKK
jgi:hypothetical protein